MRPKCVRPNRSMSFVEWARGMRRQQNNEPGTLKTASLCFGSMRVLEILHGGSHECDNKYSDMLCHGAVFTAETQSTQSLFLFMFSAETPENM